MDDKTKTIIQNLESMSLVVAFLVFNMVLSLIMMKLLTMML